MKDVVSHIHSKHHLPTVMSGPISKDEDTVKGKLESKVEISENKHETISMIYIIGIAGGRRVGKDKCAQIIKTNSELNWVIMSMADTLRKTVQIATGNYVLATAMDTVAEKSVLVPTNLFTCQSLQNAFQWADDRYNTETATIVVTTPTTASTTPTTLQVKKKDQITKMMSRDGHMRQPRNVKYAPRCLRQVIVPNDHHPFGFEGTIPITKSTNNVHKEMIEEKGNSVVASKWQKYVDLIRREGPTCTVGRLLQLIGSDIGRKHYIDALWIDDLEIRWISLGRPNLILVGVRFGLEAEWIKRQQRNAPLAFASGQPEKSIRSIIMRIDPGKRPLTLDSGRSSTHASEIPLPDEYVDLTIMNEGSELEFEQTIKRQLELLFV
jgi:hypothetical protein